jgi:DNA-binding protein HU-beta
VGPACIRRIIVAESVNKAELVDRLSVTLDISKKAAGEALEAIVAEITQSVAKGDKVAISGFGVFEKADRAARVGRNPQTGATVKIKATSVPKFRAGSEFKNAVAGRRATKKAAPAKKAPAKKAAAKKAADAEPAAEPVTEAAEATAEPAKKAPAKKAAAKKAAAAEPAAKKAAPAKKAAAKKAVAADDSADDDGVPTEEVSE